MWKVWGRCTLAKGGGVVGQVWGAMHTRFRCELGRGGRITQPTISVTSQANMYNGWLMWIRGADG